jgi:hypothetical protein
MRAGALVLLALAGALVAGPVAGALPGLGRRAHMTCDKPNRPDYPAVPVAPRRCVLGLQASPYEAQPVPGHRDPEAVLLRGVRWRHWGRHRAVGRGRVCDFFSRRCERARVTVSGPERILPAAGLLIYQRIRVRHIPPRRSHRRPFTDWYEPGTDY